MSFPIESVEGHFNTDSRESFISRLWNWYSNPSGAELSNPQEIYEFKLSPAFPNPFNSQSVAMFKLNNSGMINLSLYDLSGRLVSTIENNYYNVGSHQITIDANAMSLKSGTYILKLSAGELSMNQKLLFLK
ncbi:T9SS type A sorting domain-containing protein [bacterium]|nr:T9SS type A sorting domain-containing protein [bacterium]